MNQWFLQIPKNLFWIFISCLIFYFILIVFSRIMGLRSFSKLSSFDFAITLAMGALLATTIVSKEVSLAEGTVALATLFILQRLVAVARVKWHFVKKIVDNQPILLMDGPHFLRKNMRKVRITEDEIISKLRTHNINDLSQINAVVLEKSGEISVLSKININHDVDPLLLSGVKK